MEFRANGGAKAQMYQKLIFLFWLESMNMTFLISFVEFHNLKKFAQFGATEWRYKILIKINKAFFPMKVAPGYLVARSSISSTSGLSHIPRKHFYIKLFYIYIFE